MGRLLAFIDESGQRAFSPSSSKHFVMSAVAWREEDDPKARALLASLRANLGVAPGTTLHWNRTSGHSPRKHLAKSLGAAEFVTIASVVVAKHAIPADRRLTNSHEAYLHTFRFLLERLSWLARDASMNLDYTLAHVVHFKMEQLRAYEAKLRGLSAQSCSVRWENVPKGGSLDQPSRCEQLQLADIAASATAAAFEPDRFGNTERGYLLELLPRLYRRPPVALNSYGLKMHPWNEVTRALHPWVADMK